MDREKTGSGRLNKLIVSALMLIPAACNKAEAQIHKASYDTQAKVEQNIAPEEMAAINNESQECKTETREAATNDDGSIDQEFLQWGYEECEESRQRQIQLAELRAENAAYTNKLIKDATDQLAAQN